ncbi:hypothetical protein ACX9NE_02870 [Mycobacterium sp. ML4]
MANDFDWLFGPYPTVTRMYFNGAAAARLLEQLIQHTTTVTSRQLPSTSPAHAIPRAAKLAAWAH